MNRLEEVNGHVWQMYTMSKCGRVCSGCALCACMYVCHLYACCLYAGGVEDLSLGHEAVVIFRERHSMRLWGSLWNSADVMVTKTTVRDALSICLLVFFHLIFLSSFSPLVTSLVLPRRLPE